MAIRLVFVLSILALLCLAQVYWWRRARKLIDKIQTPSRRSLAHVALWMIAAFLIVTAFSRVAIRILPRTGPGAWVAGIGQLWLFAGFFAFLGVKTVHGFEWVWKRMRKNPSESIATGFEPSRRLFFRNAALLAGLAPVGAAAYGFTSTRWNFQVRREEIPISNLPPELDGLRIAQLSDIHMSSFMPAEEVRRAVDMANNLNADLTVVTGDLITGEGDSIDDCVAELARLRSTLGIWGCNGNHEIYAEAEDAAEEAYRRHGMTLLRQRNTQLDWHGQKLNLIGVDYQRDSMTPGGAIHPMLWGIESLVRRDMPNILLSHNPNSFYRAAEMGIELSLAGHTHGGQVEVEIIDHRISPARFVTKFIAGHYQLPAGTDVAKQARLYVNRGLGTIGIPARLGVNPEITEITLRRA